LPSGGKAIVFADFYCNEVTNYPYGMQRPEFFLYRSKLLSKLKEDFDNAEATGEQILIPNPI
jgi:hypothetical protein